jgi:hypothetical protein
MQRRHSACSINDNGYKGGISMTNISLNGASKAHDGRLDAMKQTNLEALSNCSCRKDEEPQAEVRKDAE